jgi:metallo-beta-lactamase superfamily protein
MRRVLRLPVTAALAPLVAAQSPTQLHGHVIDVEGAPATLFVLPSGGSLLVDTGWAGFNGRDADRIAAAAQGRGISRIDTLVVTHSVWQIHTAVAADAHGVAGNVIANVDETTGSELTIAADRDGSLSVTNARNGHTKRYPKK